MTDGKILKEMMNKIIERGSTFSLDDYGTGYSNLVELLELPFRIVKIDEPYPTEELVKKYPEYYDLYHKPDFLFVKAAKNTVAV